MQIVASASGRRFVVVGGLLAETAELEKYNASRQRMQYQSFPCDVIRCVEKGHSSCR